MVVPVQVRILWKVAMTALLFRKARIDEAGQIAALVNSAYRGESSRAGWTTEADFLDGQRTDLEEISGLIGKAASLILLCLDGNDLIGSVHLEKSADAACLGMLAINPQLQGRGVGKMLLTEAESMATDAWHSDKMKMAVITIRPELIAYYERRGYRRTGVHKVFPADICFGIQKVKGLKLEWLEKDLRSR